MYIVVLIEVSTKEGDVYNILMFVTWILPQITACSFVFNQLEASFLTNQKLAWRSLKSGTRKYRPLVPRVNKNRRLRACRTLNLTEPIAAM